MTASSNLPERAPLRVAILLWLIIVGAPAVAVGIHAIWPHVIWLRAVACGLVVVPGVIVLTMGVVLVTERKGSILNAWVIILPIVAAVISLDHGWAAVLWVLAALGVLYLAAVPYYWLVLNKRS